ncbi:MAG: DUF1670 domain-containing protein [Chloroflexi bacterium]|nr:DUF1670 domain-containing protein [Chloroflexota bacterium]MBU1747734.1 DUF1670 domain-containing protein [Chloroflexota bacterium]MBU1879046.1 DUF1670 domain-containing protein [Chloroflexota bacterium]
MIIPRGLIIQLYNRGLADEDIARQMRQNFGTVKSCIKDYEQVTSLLGQGYGIDEIGQTVGIPERTALEYLSLAYRFNPHLK